MRGLRRAKRGRQRATPPAGPASTHRITHILLTMGLATRLDQQHLFSSMQGTRSLMIMSPFTGRYNTALQSIAFPRLTSAQDPVITPLWCCHRKSLQRSRAYFYLEGIFFYRPSRSRLDSSLGLQKSLCFGLCNPQSWRHKTFCFQLGFPKTWKMAERVKTPFDRKLRPTQCQSSQTNQTNSSSLTSARPEPAREGGRVGK